MLTAAEREHLFLLALGRPPEVQYQHTGGVTPRLQRVLDSLHACPAMMRNATWDVIAWNPAAAVVFTDYGLLPLAERNILRMMFLDPKARMANPDWRDIARFVVGVFRGDAARTGAVASVQPLVDELCAKSPEFAALWHDTEVYSSCEALRRLSHSKLGEIALEYSAFAVDGRPDLAMLVYMPVSTDDTLRIEALVAQGRSRESASIVKSKE